MPPRLTRLELILVAIVFAIGLGLRAAYPSRMAVEHFDEGVYASNLYSPEGRYPFQHLYAPPLLPFFLEWAAIFGGPHAVMWVNVVSGSLTLLALWGMVRQWWGPPAAIAAMVLLAFNDFHIAYSRAALTDAMLGLWMTAGVWAGWRAIQFGGVGNIIAAGVLAALAWWTKYNGWLTLAITGSGTAGWILLGGGRALGSGGREPPDGRPSASRSAKHSKSPGGLRPPLADAPKKNTVFGAARIFLSRWFLTAAIAVLLWSPWLWELQKYGGYSAVARNHAGYFTGLAHWGPNAWRQLRVFVWSFDLSSSMGWVFFFLLTTAAFPGAFGRRRSLNGPGHADRTRGRPFEESHLCSWISAAWLIGLAVAVPLYTPYPRLMLPLFLGFAAFAAIRAMPRTTDDPSLEHDVDGREWTPRQVRLNFAILVLSLLAMPPVWWLSRMPAWCDRTSLQQVSSQVIDRLRAESLPAEINGVRCAVYVVAEPGLYFHLAATPSDNTVAQVTLPAADFEMTRAGANQTGLAWYVVAGPHAEASRPGEADRLIEAGRLEQIAEFEYRPSELVLLDSRPSWDLPPKDQPVVERIRLLHVKP